VTDDFSETGEGPFDVDSIESVSTDTVTGAVPNDALRDLIEAWRDNDNNMNLTGSDVYELCASELEGVIDDE